MSAPAGWSPTVARLRAGGLATFATCAALLTLTGAVAALPAHAGPPARQASVEPGDEVAPLSLPQLEELLGEVPLAVLDKERLAEILAQLPGLEALSSEKLLEALQQAIAGLGAGATLGELAGGELLAELETELEGLLTPAELLALLEGGGLEGVLAGPLGAVTPAQLLGSLLESSAEPQALMAAVLAALSSEEVDGLLGSSLEGEPFAKLTVGELAAELGTTATALGEALGTPLPEEALAMTAPLANGQVLAVLDGPAGLRLSLLGSASSGTGPGGGGPGGGGSPGTPGASGGSGSTTVIVNNALAPHQGGGTGGPAFTAPAARLKILSHRVRGRVATLVLQVPAAGRLTLSGRGIATVHVRAAHAGRLTVHAVLDRAGLASLHARRGPLRIKLRGSFAPAAGPGSAATVTVAFR